MQRRAIVTVLNAHCQDMDITFLTSDLKIMGIMTTEQCQKLASLDDEKRHVALMCILLAHDGPDMYRTLVRFMGMRYTSIAEDLQGVLVLQLKQCAYKLSSTAYGFILLLFNAATFKDLMKSPGNLTVIGSSQCKYLCHSYSASYNVASYNTNLQ